MQKSVNLANFEAAPEQFLLVFTYDGNRPLIANALDSGYNLVAWTGSSRFLIAATGLHTDPVMSVIYTSNGTLASAKIDWEPIVAFGRKCWPWDGSGPLIHDSILEVCSGAKDSVYCLYQKWRNPMGLFVPVKISIKDRSHPERVTFTFLKPVWSNDNPHLADLLKNQ